MNNFVLIIEEKILPNFFFKDISRHKQIFSRKSTKNFLLLLFQIIRSISTVKYYNLFHLKKYVGIESAKKNCVCSSLLGRFGANVSRQKIVQFHFYSEVCKQLSGFWKMNQSKFTDHFYKHYFLKFALFLSDNKDNLSH